MPVSRKRGPKKKRRIPSPRSGARRSSAVEAPSRYTPPVPSKRWRPTWHRVVGGSLLALGLLVVILNYLEEFEMNTMPGPHSEIYFVLGLVIAGYSTWWFGWFDRATKVTR